jgi:hypothetical protein
MKTYFAILQHRKKLSNRKFGRLLVKNYLHVRFQRPILHLFLIQLFFNLYEGITNAKSTRVNEPLFLIKSIATSCTQCYKTLFCVIYDLE